MDYKLRKIILSLFALLSISSSVKADSFNEIIKDLKKPYAVTKAPNSDVRCVWTKGDNGYLQNENFGNEGTSLCWSRDALNNAEEMERNGTLHWVDATTSPTDFFTDLHNACFYGYMGKQTGDWETYLAEKYAKTVSKYAGQKKPIEKLGRAFDFGKKVSKSPHDCMFISKELFVER